jgi:alpha-2-macroglobulin
MKPALTHTRLTFLLTLILFTLTLNTTAQNLLTTAQDLNTNTHNLLTSPTTSYYTYIYRITDDEAVKIHKRGIYVANKNYFHTLTDSFPTGTDHTPTLPPGHYLKTYSEKGDQKIFITTIHSFDVFTLNNNTDLCIQVYDLKGNIINGATVRAGTRRLRYDRATQCYTLRKSNFKGLLTVTHDGNTAYFNLARERNNSALRRGTSTILYRTPVRYAWLPVRYIVSLPVDAVRSVIRGWPQGTINSTRFFFRRSFSKIGDIFNNSGRDLSHIHKGYMVFNKPKYMPGDTVMLKAFITGKNGNPITEPLSVFLFSGTRDILLGETDPYAPGGYSYRFYLHDTLTLRLDRHYNISLRKNKKTTLISDSFKYEDYELKSTKLAIRTTANEHYRGQSLSLFIRGTDENDLNLPDGRYTVTVKPKDIKRYEVSRLFIPDTLFHTSGTLNYSGETGITIPDSAFPQATMSYNIEVKLLTSDNQSLTESKTINYWWQPVRHTAELFSDSIRFDLLRNGISTQDDISISASDNFGNETLLWSGSSPHNLPINPFFSSYSVTHDTITQYFPLSDHEPLIQAGSHRTADSVFISIDNPREIPFVYNIYSRNNEKTRGTADLLRYADGASPNRNWFLALRYIWGGQVVNETFRIPFHKSLLNISVDGPALVYPGQQASFKVSVTDAEGKPVSDADLTAWSVTRKFGYSPPALPAFPDKSRNKNLINNFTISTPVFNSPKMIRLDYQAWKILAGIDSIEYYSFLYPGKSVYHYSTPATGGISQFAPFVFSDGQSEPIHVIYADSRPVWFSWSTNQQPWSFPVDSGYRQVKIRTEKNLIIIDSLYIRHASKNIFSIDVNQQPDKVDIINVRPELSAHEIATLSKYTFPVRNNFGDRYAYIETSSGIQLLKHQYQNNRRPLIAGPVSGAFRLNVIDGYSISMVHEPGFEYEFSPTLAKMRTTTTDLLPAKLARWRTEMPLKGFALTEDILNRDWQTYQDARRLSDVRFPQPAKTESGYGRLQIGYRQPPPEAGNTTNDDVLLNILVFRHDFSGFVRVLPGQQRTINQLEEGFHRLVFFYNQSRYHVTDSVLVQRNGTTWCEVTRPLTLEHDTFSLKVNEIIEKAIASGNTNLTDARTRTIHSSYVERFWSAGGGGTVAGYVRDETDGEPIPGVSVFIKDTSIGTSTDIEGYYSLTVPPGTDLLCFAFIGFDTYEALLSGSERLDVILSPTLLALDEVVVTGFGSQRKSSVTAAVVTISTSLEDLIEIPSTDMSSALSGRLAGLSIMNASEGDPGGGVTLSIRGASSVSFERKPLIILNGMVYTGDLSSLDASMFSGIEVLKDERATALYGSAGTNGVIVITTSQSGFKTMATAESRGAAFDAMFLEAASAASSLRTNFSDYAFWMPELRTDLSGKASFSVTFPDDVTAWETFYMAMTGRKQAGQTRGMVRSYKPLMAQISSPRFLIENDTARAIGKIVNYLSEPVEINTTFDVNGITQFSVSRSCAEAIIDTLTLTAGSDSLIVKYMIERPDGYLDGEQREIAVYPRGLEVTEGMFATLDRDTALTLSFDNRLGDVKLYARSSMIDVVNDDISRLIRYRHQCNEQLASRLIALLSEKKIKQFRGEKFSGDREVERMIRLLSGNRSADGLWGWWKGSPQSDWISLHVLEALEWARFEGYIVEATKTGIVDNLLWRIENTTGFEARVSILRMLRLAKARVNYNHYIGLLEQNDSLRLGQMLQIMEMRQSSGLPCNTDTLMHYMKTTLFGGVYFSDEDSSTPPWRMFGNDVQTTVLAYRVLRADTATSPDLLRKMRNYFMEQRYGGRWLNTFETSQMLTAIVPDLLNQSGEAVASELRFTGGGLPRSVEKFPFEAVVKADDSVTVSYSGTAPVWFTAWQHRWEPDPKAVEGDFAIVTSFEGNTTGVLEAGVEATMIVEVQMKKPGDYVMITVPVPAGCSYGENDARTRFEVHREYYRNETAIFCERLPIGTHRFTIRLLPRYTGTFTLNPAKVELMYFPTFNGNNEIRTVMIK